MKKKIIKIWGTTCFARERMRAIIKLMEHAFDFVETQNNPDYLICYNMDYFALTYPGVRIWLAGENLIPDFNTSDYAIGFNDIHFGDRYLRWPLYRWHQTLSECEAIREKANERSATSRRKRLCACVISNVSNRQGPLVEICDALNSYHGMTYGGKWRNNIGGRVKDKQALLLEHKFTLAFENTAYPGYTTEKIIDAFLAGTIPIYWGDPAITQHFNAKAFIQCREGEPIADVVQRIKTINESPECYEAMLREPIFTPGAGEALQEERLIEFLKAIFSQPLERAYRRNRSRWGIKYEESLKRMFFKPWSHVVRLPKIWAVHCKNNKI